MARRKLAPNELGRDIGQGELLPDLIWVLIDRSNPERLSHRYLIWFRTQLEALNHKHKHNLLKHHAKLSGPYRFVYVPKIPRETLVGDDSDSK